MISGVAFCPQAPALVPDVGRGADAELADVRAACRAAIRRVAPPTTRIVVIGSGEGAASYGPTSRGTFAGFGVDLVVSLGSDDDGPIELPPSLTVGAWLVRDAIGPNSGATGFAVAPGSESWDGDHPTALVVLGDGSARRSEKAPGYLDARAEAFDAAVSAALGAGDADALAAASGAGGDLLAAGAPVWSVVSPTLAAERPEWAADLLYDDAPLGVGYLVATWSARD